MACNDLLQFLTREFGEAKLLVNNLVRTLAAFAHKIEDTNSRTSEKTFYTATAMPSRSLWGYFLSAGGSHGQYWPTRIFPLMGDNSARFVPYHKDVFRRCRGCRQFHRRKAIEEGGSVSHTISKVTECGYIPTMADEG